MTQSHDHHVADAAHLHGAGEHGSHGDASGHEREGHAHPAATLGPVDWPAHGAGLLGVLVGLVITAALILATGPAS